MMWMHKIVWVCGQATYRWVLVSKIEFARTVHLTAAMIKLKAAKLSIAILCAGGFGVAIPPLLDVGGRPSTPVPAIVTPFRSDRLPATSQDVPEPWSIALLAAGIVGIRLARRSR
jgi:hypothetical protein